MKKRKPYCRNQACEKGCVEIMSGSGGSFGWEPCSYPDCPFTKKATKRVTQTSRDAYREHQPKLEPEEKIVLKWLIASDGSCISDIARAAKIDKCSVSARMNRLRKLGKIVFVGVRKSATTGINSNFYKMA